MISQKVLFKFLLLVLLGLIVAMLIHRWVFKSVVYNNDPDNEPLIPHPLQILSNLPKFDLLDPGGNPQSIEQWQGKIIILNFWATWCPPCREEIPGFVALQKQLGAKGVQFVGIAIDDPVEVRNFATQAHFNYPILVGDSRAIELSEQLGNHLQGLPFSVIFNRDGDVIYKTLGELSPDTIHAEIDPLL